MRSPFLNPGTSKQTVLNGLVIKKVLQQNGNLGKPLSGLGTAVTAYHTGQIPVNPGDPADKEGTICDPTNDKNVVKLLYGTTKNTVEYDPGTGLREVYGRMTYTGTYPSGNYILYYYYRSDAGAEVNYNLPSVTGGYDYWYVVRTNLKDVVEEFAINEVKELPIDMNWIPVYASDPATPFEGQVWLNSTTDLFKGYDGVSVNILGKQEVKKDNGTTIIRRILNFITGANTTLTVTEDIPNEKIDITIAVPDASTTVKGVVELATDGEAIAGVAVQGNDSRLVAGLPLPHDLAGGQHNADTITNLNLKLSDGDVISNKPLEINALTPKSPVVAGDIVMIEDSAGGLYTKAKALLSTILAYFKADTDVASAISLKHARSHVITSTSDHSSTATPNQMLKADANGLPVDASNTDAQVSGAVSASHARLHAYDSVLDHSGTLSPANITPGTASQVLQTVGGVATWQTLPTASTIEVAIKRVWDYTGNVFNHITQLFPWDSPNKLAGLEIIISGTPASPTSVHWCPNGEIFVTIENNATKTQGIRVYTHTGRLFQDGFGSVSAYPTGQPTTARWSKNGEFLAVNDVTGGVYPTLLWYQRSGYNLTKLADPATMPPVWYSCDWSPNGRVLIFGTGGGLRIYTRSGSSLVYAGSTGAFNTNCVRFSNNNEMLFIASTTSPYVYFYKYYTYYAVANPPTAGCFSCDWSPDDKNVAVVGLGGMFIYTRSGTTFTRQPMTWIGGFVPQWCVWSPNGRYVAVGGANAPYIAIWDFATASWLSAPSSPPSANVFSVEWSPNSEFLVMCLQNSPWLEIYQTTSDMPTAGTLVCNGVLREGT